MKPDEDILYPEKHGNMLPHKYMKLVNFYLNDKIESCTMNLQDQITRLEKQIKKLKEKK